MENALDSRFTVRVRTVWNKLAAHRIPRRSQVDPKNFGSDWSNCLTIDLDSEVLQSRFGYVGESLRDLTSKNLEKLTLFELPKEILVKIISPLIPKVIKNKMPVSFAGLAQHNDKNILYRTVLTPLSENGDQVDGIVAGVTYREVFVQQELLDPPIKPSRKKKQRRVAKTRSKTKKYSDVKKQKTAI